MAILRLCSVDNCGKPLKARGFCSAHWERWRKHGDPLGGRTPNGEALAWLEKYVTYEGKDCLPWPFTCSPQGYGQVWYEGKLILATRLMCERAHGPAPKDKPYALHSCGRGHLACINQSHLFWGSPKRNQFDRIKDGTTNRGRANGQSRLTEADVRAIRRFAGQKTPKQLATEYGVTSRYVSDIVRGAAWSWLK